MFLELFILAKTFKIKCLTVNNIKFNKLGYSVRVLKKSNKYIYFYKFMHIFHLVIMCKFKFSNIEIYNLYPPKTRFC